MLPILLVGGGPSGLTSAVHLQRSGVPHRLIERRRGVHQLSKALSLSSSTLELFEDLGLVEAALAAARLNDAVQIFWKGRELHDVSLAGIPSRYPFFAMLPQYETERLLRARLAQLGGSVEEGTALVDLEARADRVIATTEDDAGRRTRRPYAYVVGCDGARSAVRRLAGIPFEGHDYPMYFAMCDAPVRWPGREGRWGYFVDEERFGILIPLSRTLHRVVVQDRGRFDPERVWRREDFLWRLHGIGLAGIELGELTWSTSARFYNRLAGCFRKGRVFLVGDAAHLFSPIGGQGMNTGVQDAYNLAWRLALCQRGLAREALLDGYERERRPYAEGVRASTDAMTRVIARLDRDPRGPLRRFLPSARGGAFLAHTLPRRLAGLAAAYGVEPDGPPAAGRRLTRSRLHDPGGGRYVLAVAGGISSAVVRLVRDYRAILALRELDPAEARALGLDHQSLLLVRPDRFVAYAGRCSSASDVAPLREYVKVSHGGESFL
ncbi:MAG: FAD-dependent monooxygenase [Planctomycetota bacterium]